MTTEIKMTRDQLITSFVEMRVARWGEGERVALQKIAQAKTTRTLEYKYADDTGSEIVERPSDLSYFIAADCLDSGHS